MRTLVRAVRLGAATAALLAIASSAAAALVPLGGVAKVVGGRDHACAVTQGGKLACWGANDAGQLGDGTTTRRLTPIEVPGFTLPVTAAAAGLQHTCAVVGGAAKCWGGNGNGELGDNTTSDHRSVPGDVAGLSSGVTAISAGARFSCAVVGGAAKCWGSNDAGQLGDNSTTERWAPVTVTGLGSGVTTIVAAGQHACALTTAGGVKCWGANADGQLGNNSTAPSLVPVDVSGLTSGVQAIAGAYSTTCALTTASAVKCWGDNAYAQIGDSSLTDRVIPTNVSGLTSGVTAISVSGLHACALMAAGGARCWGYNSYGQAGDGTNTRLRLVPVDVLGMVGGQASISAAGLHSCAVASSGNVSCWGSNAAGELGDGTPVRKLEPTDVAGLGSGVAAVAAGFHYTCALTTGGAVKCWGLNASGPLGDGTATDRASPVDVVGLQSGVSAIAVRQAHACALTNTGAMKCWGNNTQGQLGNNTITTSTVPVDVSGLASGVSAIAVGASHTCAVVSGAAKCWGSNALGAVGDNTNTQRRTPVTVFGLASGVAAIAAGTNHSCAVTSVGGVKCWGNNAGGQLGDGTLTDSPFPVDVTGLANGVSAVSAGHYHTCALMQSGGVKCWGLQTPGLGDGTRTFLHLTPVDVAGLSSGVGKLVTYDHTCAIAAGGIVRCWGVNATGQLGDYTTFDRVAPVVAPGLGAGVSAIATGYTHSCAVTSAGALKCWGDNLSGEIGDGTEGFRRVPFPVLAFGSTLSAAVSTTGSHTIAVDTAGKVYAWGSDSHGQLGQGRAINRVTPAQVTGIPSLSRVSLSQHILAVDATNQVWSWGENACGQLGPRSSAVTTKPATVTGVTNATRVASGSCFSLVLKQDGTVWGWGLVPGYGTQTDVRQLAGLSGIVDIQAGNSHALALRNDNRVLAFGDNAFGQLGQGAPGPAQGAILVPGVVDAAEIAAGRDSSAVRLANGLLYSWGRQSDDALALSPQLLPAPSSAARSLSFAGSELVAALIDGSVARLPSPAAGWQPVSGYAGIAKIEAGLGFDLGIGAGGQVFARGANTAGQLGQGDTNTHAGVLAVAGMSGVASLAAGTINPSVLALKGDGTLWFWGADTFGESGDGGAIGASVPLAVSIPVPVRQVATGDRFSAALDANGDVWGWGDNGSAPLDSTLVNRSTPARIPGASNVQAIAAGGSGLMLYHGSDGSVSLGGTLLPAVVTDAPTQVPGLTGASAITAGTSAYALRGNALYAFGSNGSGELGDGTTTSRILPVQVLGIAGTIAKISAGRNRAAAVTSDGKVWSWGAAPVGNGTPGSSLSAVAATGIADAAEVSVGRLATLVRRQGGGMLAWGDTGLADATGHNPLLPYPIAFHEPVRSVRLGGTNALGYIVGNTGLLWGFGQHLTTSNVSVAIGDGAYVQRDRPVVVNAVGGSGNIDSNDWFLDLEPATAESVPVASRPKVLGSSQLSGFGGADGLTLSASLKPRAADQGKTAGTYVFAFVPSDFLDQVKRSPSLTKARVAELEKSGGLLFLQLTPDGWADATNQLIAYTSGVLSGAQQPVKILQGTPVTAIPGVRFCVGYGETPGAMMVSSTLLEVLRVGNALSSEGGSSCVLNGVYVSGPPTSIQGSSVTFQATVVGATPTGTVQFKDTVQSVTQNLQSPVALALANEAIATATISTNTLSVATHSIGAQYSGNTQNAPRSTDTPLVHQVSSALPGATVALSGPVGSAQGQAVNFSATVTGNNPTGTVQFKVDGTNLGAAVPLLNAVAPYSTSALASGVRHVTAVYSGDGANATATSNEIVHTVSNVTTPVVTLSASPSPVQAGSPLTLNVAVTGTGPTGAITFRDSGASMGVVNLAGGAASLMVSNLAAGLHRVTADYAGDGSNAPASSTTYYLQVTVPPSLVPITVGKLGQGTGTVSSGPAGIDCGPTCSAQFLTGSTVTLTAAPAAGSTFVGWTGACVGSAACSLSISAAASVTARFEIAGTGVAIAPAALAFGGQSLNTTAPTQVATLTNNSGAPITVTSMVAPPGFGTGSGCSSVPAGASCQLYVNFTPSAEGDLVANVAVLYTQAAETRSSLLPVSGTGEKSLVTHYYRSILRRAPDAPGKAFWEGEAARLQSIEANINETWFAMSAFFYSSAEYASFNRDNAGFVTDLYNTFFNRAPDGPGLGFWTDLIGSGMPREVILTSFMFSPEFASFTQAIFGNTAARAEVDMVFDFYRGLLARLPDATGFTNWRGSFRTAQCAANPTASVYGAVENISKGFIASAEYTNRNRTNSQYVGDLYNAALRRGGDLNGVNFWINQLNTSAMTREQVRQQFIASGEFTARVNNVIAQGCLP